MREQETPVPPATLTGVLLRLYWMLGGQIAAIACLFMIIRDDPSLLSPVSVAFWALLAMTIVARYVDVTRFGGLRTDAVTRATLSDVKRFALGAVSLGAAVWTGAHFL
ncbi:MAG: hypothetical protein P1V51_24070 [Deltaproteobacteria bacterium]|nr:hypothetical protein [Deltaproteobacteria bacterium]